MNDPAQWQKMMRYASLGLEFIVTFGLFLAGGIYLDGRFSTKPLLTLIGLATGFGLGLFRMVVELRRQERRDRERQDRKE